MPGVSSHPIHTSRIVRVLLSCRPSQYDTVCCDPLFSVPLPSEYITDPELKSVQLCFEVHGQSGTTYYNQISDRCTSVIALYVYSAGVVNSDRNVITKVDARTQGTSGTVTL